MFHCSHRMQVSLSLRTSLHSHHLILQVVNIMSLDWVVPYFMCGVFHYMRMELSSIRRWARMGILRYIIHLVVLFFLVGIVIIQISGISIEVQALGNFMKEKWLHLGNLWFVVEVDRLHSMCFQCDLVYVLCDYQSLCTFQSPHENYTGWPLNYLEIPTRSLLGVPRLAPCNLFTLGLVFGNFVVVNICLVCFWDSCSC